MQARRKIIVFLLSIVMLFTNNIALAAPGDTMTIYTNAPSVLNGSAPNTGTPVSIASFTNTKNNVSISNIRLSWDSTIRASVGYTTTLSGWVRWSIKKNGVNGQVVWQNTATTMNLYSDQGSLPTPNDAAKNVTLFPGESLHLVIEQTFGPISGYKPSLYAERRGTYSWTISYWETDMLIQDGVDASKTAATNATNAMNAANAANWNADQARQFATWANTNAETTKNNILWGTDNGGKSLGATYDKAGAAADLAGYIRNTQLPALETKINNMQVAVTNIQNSDTLPPAIEVQTVSGARATSASSIAAIVTVTDNKAGPYTYSVNGGSYITLPSDGRISLPVSSSGNNSITVSVKDMAGNVGSKTIVIRKL